MSPHSVEIVLQFLVSPLQEICEVDEVTDLAGQVFPDLPQQLARLTQLLCGFGSLVIQ